MDVVLPCVDDDDDDDGDDDDDDDDDPRCYSPSLRLKSGALSLRLFPYSPPPRVTKG